MWLKGVNGSRDPHLLDQTGKVSNHVKGIQLGKVSNLASVRFCPLPFFG